MQRNEVLRSLYLYTTFVLPAARPLYEKNGFYVVRETEPEEWFDMAGIEMEKEIEGSACGTPGQFANPSTR